MGAHPILYRELIWFGIAGPLFGAACAWLAKEWGRRQWLWSLLGFFFNINAVLVLIFLETYRKDQGPDATGRRRGVEPDKH